MSPTDTPVDAAAEAPEAPSAVATAPDPATLLRDRLVLAALASVPFDGWSLASLRQGAEAEGFDPGAADRAFPRGGVQAAVHFIDLANRMMAEDLAAHLSAPDAGSLRLHERVRLAIKLRLERWADHREAVRRGVALLSLPTTAHLGLRSAYDTADAIWRAVGDRSVDMGYYSKRAQLAGIYSATLLVWLEDTSEGASGTWGFLDRRLHDVLRLRRARDRVERRLERLARLPERLPDPTRALRRPLERLRGGAEGLRPGA